MDKSVKPGDNFAAYATGTWEKGAVIPADRSRIGGFTDLQILSEKRLRTIVDDLHARPAASLNVDERKLKDFYDSFMDTAAIEANGLKPLQKDLAEIAGLKTPAQVARIMARRYGEQSEKESDKAKDLGEELADVLFVLLCLANQTGTDLGAAWRKKFAERTVRDRERHQVNPKLK